MPLIRIFLASLSLLFCRPVRIDRNYPGQRHFWMLMLLNVAVGVVYDYFAAESPRYFDISGLQSEAVVALLLILLGSVAARVFSQADLFWRLPSLVLAASLLLDIVTAWLYLSLLPAFGADAAAYYLVWVSSLFWMLLVVFAALRSLVRPLSWGRSLSMAAGFAAVFSASMIWLNLPAYWAHDYYAAYQAEQADEPENPAISAEELLFMQSGMLSRALDGLSPQRPGVPDMYFLSFGSYGDEGVFRREVNIAVAFFANALLATDGCWHWPITATVSRHCRWRLPPTWMLRLRVWPKSWMWMRTSCSSSHQSRLEIPFARGVAGRCAAG